MEAFLVVLGLAVGCYILVKILVNIAGAVASFLVFVLGILAVFGAFVLFL